MRKIIGLLAALLAYVSLAFAGVNINSATQEQLETLNGVGPVKAQAIIDYRKKNGPFKSLEDIKKVDGIGDATYDKIKGDIMLSGRTEPKKAADDKKAADLKAREDAKKAAADKKAADKKAREEAKKAEPPKEEPKKP
jgi:competence protein ComEA